MDIDRLERLVSLREKGGLTEAEFEAQKRLILDDSAEPSWNIETASSHATNDQHLPRQSRRKPTSNTTMIALTLLCIFATTFSMTIFIVDQKESAAAEAAFGPRVNSGHGRRVFQDDEIVTADTGGEGKILQACTLIDGHTELGAASILTSIIGRSPNRAEASAYQQRGLRYRSHLDAGSCLIEAELKGDYVGERVEVVGSCRVAAITISTTGEVLAHLCKA